MLVLSCFIVLSRDCVVFVFCFLVYDEGDLVTAVFVGFVADFDNTCNTVVS